MKDGDVIDGKQIVLKIEDGMDPRGAYCTTYQMRNFYKQFADGFFSNLDVMNYIQHHVASTEPRKGQRILDVCCGRGLMLPLLRYNNKEIAEYVGVDISTRNLAEAKRLAESKEFPFPVNFVEADVSRMADAVSGKFDFVIYTSAIEHMHKQVGATSLRQVWALMNPGAKMILSCPNTPGNGYDTQYAAHIYEWGLAELKEELGKVGFVIEHEVGLVFGAKDMHAFFMSDQVSDGLRQFYLACKKYLPTKFLTAFMSIPFPDQSKEVLLEVRKP